MEKVEARGITRGLLFVTVYVMFKSAVDVVNKLAGKESFAIREGATDDVMILSVQTRDNGTRVVEITMREITDQGPSPEAPGGQGKPICTCGETDFARVAVPNCPVHKGN